MPYKQLVPKLFLHYGSNHKKKASETEAFII